MKIFDYIKSYENRNRKNLSVAGKLVDKKYTDKYSRYATSKSINKQIKNRDVQVIQPYSMHRIITNQLPQEKDLNKEAITRRDFKLHVLHGDMEDYTEPSKIKKSKEQKIEEGMSWFK